MLTEMLFIVKNGNESTMNVPAFVILHTHSLQVSLRFDNKTLKKILFPERKIYIQVNIIVQLLLVKNCDIVIIL